MAGTLTDRMSRGVCDGDYAAAVKVWVKAGEKRCGRKAVRADLFIPAFCIRTIPLVHGR